MTNEEKAKEIIQGVIHDRGCTDVATDRAIYNSAMTMAEWKDKQLKAEKQALIDKACEFISKNIESDKYLSPDEESYRMGCGVDYLETDMFIEDFKNHMRRARIQLIATSAIMGRVLQLIGGSVPKGLKNALNGRMKER